MSLADFIISIFCVIEDELKKLNLSTLRQRGFEPGFSDSEVITLEVVGEFLGMDTDKGIWRYFKTHWSHFFPRIPCRTTFIRQAANLWKVKQFLHGVMSKACGGNSDPWHIVDGLPMPVCSLGHAHSCQLFKNQAHHGYCAAKDEHYYGFKGHILINSEGVIWSSDLAAANVDERDVLPLMTGGVQGLLLGDKGYIRPILSQEMEQNGIKLLTPVRCNMKKGVWEKAKKFFGDTRRRIETVISQLSERFHAEKVRARDLWHLTSRWARKMLSHTLAIWINKMRGANPLDFEGIISDL